ncbi:MAG: glycosyl hydrolase family 38 [Bacteroidetes bacterium]|nr:glycosyl hydrolase family 38 [Bacteroidota bacterium]
MTFKSELQSGIEVNPYPAVLKNGNERTQVLGVNVYYFGPSVKGKLFVNGKLDRNIDLDFGHRFYRISIPTVEVSKEVSIRIESSRFSAGKTVTIEPVRPWRINFVQHTHTDIGYTRPQTEILPEHLRFIDYALDYCDKTDDYPDAAKFRWTCEASWAVDEYLKCRPHEQIERLKKRVNEGRIEITGMYFNFDELPDEQVLAASLVPIKRIREAGLPVTTAMQNDVNGIGWCLNDFFYGVGIKYLNMGTHGHRALIAFDKPTAFWWESPSGNKILTYRAEHYMTGNTVFGIHTGDFNNFEDKLLTYLANLGDKGYPYNITAIQYSGYLTDNSPPSTLASDMIKKWNEVYEWPKLRTAVVSEFFKEIEEKYADDLPVYRAAWPDWWTDGFGSGAREVAATRQAHVDLIANQGGMSMAVIMNAGIPDEFNQRVDEANKALLFYGEHTFGSSESVRNPYGESTMEQRRLKESYAWEAFKRSRMVGEEAMGCLQSKLHKTDVPSLTVFNTLNWRRSGLATVYIDHQVLPKDRKFRFVDQEGNEAPAQAFSHRSDGTQWGIWVKDVPPFGYKTYRLELSEGYIEPVEVEQSENAVFENEWYRIRVDSRLGAVTSLYDKRNDTELVDGNAKWKLGAFIYERLGNRNQMEAFTMNDYKRFPLDTVYLDAVTHGPVYDAVRFAGEIEYCSYSPGGFVAEIRLYHTSPLIGMEYTLLKKPVTDPEAVYIAFPFQLDDGKIFCEVAGGVMEAGVDQIPGSANDWNTVQNFVTVRNSKMQIILGSHETPLMQFGGINTGRYDADAVPETTHIFSWPMNNYWTTNFNADQHGSFSWSYFLTTTDNTGIENATRTGWSNRIPFLCRVLPAGEEKTPLQETSVLKFSSGNLLLVNARPGELKNSVVLQIREVAGKNTTLEIESPYLKNGKLMLQEVDATGRAISKKSINLEIKPFRSAFIKVFIESRF